jgi:hypothetical protein
MFLYKKWRPTVMATHTHMYVSGASQRWQLLNKMCMLQQECFNSIPVDRSKCKHAHRGGGGGISGGENHWQMALAWETSLALDSRPRRWGWLEGRKWMPSTPSTCLSASWWGGGGAACWNKLIIQLNITKSKRGILKHKKEIRDGSG